MLMNKDIEDNENNNKNDLGNKNLTISKQYF